jgi:hypothetical protein
VLRRLSVVAVVTSAALGGPLTGAHANGGMGSTLCDLTSCQQSAEYVDPPPATPGPAHKSGSRGPVCSETAFMTPLVGKVVNESKGDGPQVVYHEVCVLDGQPVASRLVEASRPSASVTKSLAERAYKTLTMPKPEPVMSPAANIPQLAGLPVWLWLRPGTWTPKSSTVSAGGVTVTATAVPQRVDWSMGDGSTVRCAGPGTPFSATTSTDGMAPSPDCGSGV